MTERFRQVVPLKIDYWCDSCNESPLQVSGPALPNGKIPHYCPNCEALVQLDQGYPMIRFDDIKEQSEEVHELSHKNPFSEEFHSKGNGRADAGV